MSGPIPSNSDANLASDCTHEEVVAAPVDSWICHKLEHML
jgi:hypothetical protein